MERIRADLSDKKRKKVWSKLKLEEYARPELGEFDEDSGHLKLKIRKILLDNNSKSEEQSEDLEKALDLFWGFKA